MRIALLVALALSATSLQSAGRLDARVKGLLAHSRAMREGYAGVLVVDEKGRTLLSINSDRAFVPASNAKLFSIALALERLGPDKRFETRVEQRGDDLVLIGTGDANLSGTVLPYQYNSQPGPPLAAIDDLAAQIASHGVHEVQGDIIGDDAAFLYEPYASGWAVEDMLTDDGAPVSALVVNDNCFAFRLFPGLSDGAPASMTLDPPLSMFEIQNQVVTGPPENIQSDRTPGLMTWRVWGTLPAGSKPHTELWAVDDPARFAALALRYSLEQHGVHVSGNARPAHRFPGLPITETPAGPVVARRLSPPLLQDLQFTAKTSNNLHADLLLFDVGGSREAGLEEMTHFLSEVGVPPDSYRFYDGSGLSHSDLVTPHAVITLLRYMARSPYRDDWISLLPVSGVDGSLATRLDSRRLKGRIHAKTGTLSHISALSGYADARSGRRLTFSIFVNNATVNAAAQRELIDKICALLVQQ